MSQSGYVLGFHLLNARDTSYFHWAFQQFAGADPVQFRDAMQGDVRLLREQLGTRDVDYDDLKSALVPSRSGQQVAFVYDWRDHPGWNYAVAFADLVVPHLPPKLRTSMLHGDLHAIRHATPAAMLSSALIRPVGRASYEPDWETQYAMYFSNLRPSDISLLHNRLSTDSRYGGYFDLTFSSAVRDYIAGTLAPEWVIVDRKVLMSHGGDKPWVSDEDPVGWDLPAKGFEIVSAIDSYFAGYLSYKIESRLSAQAPDDLVLNLAAVTGELISVDEVEVFVPPDKLDKYLLKDQSKLRLMTNIGLEDVDAAGLAAIVKEKLMQSYIYDLRFASDGTPTFAVSAEFEKPEGGMARRLLALKHDSVHQRISLVSMY